ncbi:hypothetical protein C2G38_2050361 [Gigaspora rosea]|uniref:Protein kinase domain-containing protein n=1 Tax=Gigaspora rosea TaxID=44941 RepID=A0A397TYN5_9GLOM|nr:hypothetical protein C2G38_2050361 [Gigaspora rosea]
METKEKPNHTIEEIARQDYIDNVLIKLAPNNLRYLTKAERFLEYGICPEPCNAIRFQRAFSTWTSGNLEIDFFIQNAQIHATNRWLVLEWYPWETFFEIEKIGEGDYGTVFRAKTRIGEICRWDYQTNAWRRSFKFFSKNDGKYIYKEHVALKTFGHPTSLSTDLLKEAKKLQRWAYQNSDWATLYGFTKNEITGQYFLVLWYFENGDLHKQLQQGTGGWREKLNIIRRIAFIWIRFIRQE